MAKTRAQRKAEKRRRQQAQRQRQPGRPEEGRAQRDTQNPVSGEVAEAEAVVESGARTEDYGEHVERGDREPQARAAVPGVTPEPVAPEPPEAPEAPAPSKADVGRPEAPAEERESRRERRAREKEERRKARAREEQRAREEKAAEKTRGPVTGFLASSWAELRKVQWPDRDTLVQASAVTLIFVAVMAAYLGALDAMFNWLIQRLI